ncbi:MAG TPA: hypothetical protein G4N92_09305 [Anaerolineae bacterium]|nr:hypothetical protein [Anaerolineae bacterium]
MDIQQTFDLQDDPLAKQKLLNGVSNIVQCPNCGYSGMLATPIVYHDPKKELLLTYFPPELNIPINEQEKQLGILINKIIERLPKEKRKAYVLQPQSMLTYQTLLEKILEEDGITKEMLEENQKRIHLLQRLITAPENNLPDIIDQEKELIDFPFFSLLSRLLQSAVAQGDKESNKKLTSLQNILFEKTKTGKEIQKTAKETEEVISTLKEAGKDGLTREKLLDIAVNACTETQLSTLVGFTRTGMDYMFFQKLSERIDSTTNTKKKQKLTTLREKLLKLTEEIDKQIQKEFVKTKKLLEDILQTENIEEGTKKNLLKISDLFVQIIKDELSIARKKGDLDRIQKLERVMVVVEKASEPPEEIKFLERLLSSKDESELQKSLSENKEMITPEFIQLLNGIMMQSEKQDQDVEGKKKLKEVYRAALRLSMKANLGK